VKDFKVVFQVAIATLVLLLPSVLSSPQIKHPYGESLNRPGTDVTRGTRLTSGDSLGSLTAGDKLKIPMADDKLKISTDGDFLSNLNADDLSSLRARDSLTLVVYDVEDIQQALIDVGFDPGPKDGRMGPRTRAAIRDFQRSNGLTPDGIVGPKTAAALQISD